jgi:hypothetical protein
MKCITAGARGETCQARFVRLFKSELADLRI